MTMYTLENVSDVLECHVFSSHGPNGKTQALIIIIIGYVRIIMLEYDNQKTTKT